MGNTWVLERWQRFVRRDPGEQPSHSRRLRVSSSVPSIPASDTNGNPVKTSRKKKRGMDLQCNTIKLINGNLLPGKKAFLLCLESILDGCLICAWTFEPNGPNVPVWKSKRLFKKKRFFFFVEKEKKVIGKIENFWQFNRTWLWRC